MIRLRSTLATKEIMEQLERENLIALIRPMHSKVPHADGCNVTMLYQTDAVYGGHKLIHVCVGRETISNLIYHPDREDFLLIGNNDSNPLYLLIARHHFKDLIDKIKSKDVSEEDFILLKCVFNDPEISFFTMNAGIPHNELSGKGTGFSPSFYVGESALLPECFVHFEDYEFNIEVIEE